MPRRKKESEPVKGVPTISDLRGIESTRADPIGINPSDKVQDNAGSFDKYDKPEKAETKMTTKFNMWAFDFENFHKVRAAVQAGIMKIRINPELAPEVLDGIDQMLLIVKQIATPEEKKALEKEMGDARIITNRLILARAVYSQQGMPMNVMWTEKIYQASRRVLNAVYAVRQLRGMGMRMDDKEEEDSDILSFFGGV